MFCSVQIVSIMKLFNFSLVFLLVLLNHSNAQVDSPRLGTIRLYSNGSTLPTLSAGIVQIYYRSHSSNTLEWGNICDNKSPDDDLSFDENEANVICNQLGYSGALDFGRADTNTSFGNDSLGASIYDTNCTTSNYLTLEQCSFKDDNVSFICDNNDDAYVECNTTRIWSRPYDGQIRVQGGTYSNFGRLEVYCNGEWGTVCNDNFEPIDATVACRQLGYSMAQSFSRSGNLPYGPSSQPVWLNDVRCSSSHDCISYCQICPRSRSDHCNHNEVVILGCEFSPTATQSNNTLNTCVNANRVATSLLIVIIVVTILGFLICTALIIGVPICICFCLGVGIGATLGSSSKKGYTPSKAAANTGVGSNAGGTSAGGAAGGGSNAAGDAAGGSQPPPKEEEKPSEEEKPLDGKPPQDEDNTYEMKEKNKDQ